MRLSRDYLAAQAVSHLGDVLGRDEDSFDSIGHLIVAKRLVDEAIDEALIAASLADKATHNRHHRRDAGVTVSTVLIEIQQRTTKKVRESSLGASLRSVAEQIEVQSYEKRERDLDPTRRS